MTLNLNNLWQKETATLTWTIENFTSNQQFNSSQFSSPTNGKNKFQLILQPQINLFGTVYVTVGLIYKGEEKELPIHYRVSIINKDNGETRFSKEFYWNFTKSNNTNYNYNITNFITSTECTNYYLVNNSLSIFCELNVLDKSFDKIDILNDFQSLLSSEKLSDFVLAIGEKEFKVHKTILASRSAVFGAMFEHAETKEAQESRAEIVDMSAEVCEQMLMYIYTGKIPPMNEFAQDLFVAADKYQLEHLQEICEQALCTSLAPETAVDVLLFADLHQAPNLKSKCLEFITKNSVKVRVTEQWKEMIKNNPELMVELYLDMSDKSESFFKAK